MPAASPSRCGSLSLSSSPALPGTCQLFNVECQGDGDVTLPAGWRPLGPTRVQRQRKALSDRSPPGARWPRAPAHPHSQRWWRGRPAACQASSCSSALLLAGLVRPPRPRAPHLHAEPSGVPPARSLRGPAWMLRLRAPSEDGLAVSRVKRPRGSQVLPCPGPSKLAAQILGGWGHCPASEGRDSVPFPC